MAHSLLLTPNKTGAVPLELIGGGIRVAGGTEGLQLPVPLYEEAYAESPDAVRGAKRVRSTGKNATAKLKVFIQGDDAASFYGLIEQWEQTVESVRRNGGTLVFTPDSGTAVTYDLESAMLTAAPLDAPLLAQYLCESEAEFPCLPYGRLEPVEAIPATTPASSTDPLLRFTVPAVDGSVSALGRLIFRDGSSQARRFLAWGKCDAADLPAGGELLDSAAMTLTGFSGSTTTRTGAHNADGVVRVTPLIPTPVTIGAWTDLAHVGYFRPTLRVYGMGSGPTGGPIYVRIAHRTAGGDWTRTRWQRVPLLGNFVEVDLTAPGDVINLPRIATGDQASEIRVEAYSETPGDTLDIDYLEMMPAKAWGKARAPLTSVTAGKVVAYDAFDTHATGALAGKTAPVGGVWGAGDLQVASGQVTESTVGKTNYRSGTHQLLPGTYTAVEVELKAGSYLPAISGAADSIWPFFWKAMAQGITVRYVDANNWAVLVRWRASAQIYYESYLVLIKKKAGSFTEKWSEGLGDENETGRPLKRLKVSIDAAGQVRGYYAALGQDYLDAKIAFTDADFATGGVLASGKVGIYDAQSAASGTFPSGVPSTAPRLYDGLVVTESTAADLTSQVMHADRELELRHDRVLRASTDGTDYADIRSLYNGRYLELDPAGQEGASEVIVAKARRTDLDIEPSVNLSDELEATLEVTPRVALLGA